MPYHYFRYDTPLYTFGVIKQILYTTRYVINTKIRSKP